MHEEARSLGRLSINTIEGKLFFLGLGLRLACLALLQPALHSSLFGPFLLFIPSSGSVDVWTAFLREGGSLIAFPYGLPYLAIYGPPVWLADILAGLLGIDPTKMAHFALGLTILVLDIALFTIIAQWIGVLRKAVKYYWLSPVVLFINYWEGQLDVLPTLLLMGAVIATVQAKSRLGGALVGIAASAKLSMLVALPFFIIFLLRNRARRQYLPIFFAFFGGTFLILMTPLVFSSGALLMILNTPEAQKLYELSFELGQHFIFLAPLAYLIGVYSYWNVRRSSSVLFVESVGLGFLPLLLLTPASPGWFMWFVPFLVWHQSRRGRTAILLGTLFGVLFVTCNALTGSGAWGALEPQVAALAELQIGTTARVVDWLYTAMISVGLLLAIQMLRDGVLRNAYFMLGSRRLVIGIAGDSGSGKDTLAEALAASFGSHSVTHISGDDYHIWDRKRPMWAVLTHLNPAANRLQDMSRDVVRLAQGSAIRKRYYDHKTGLMSRFKKYRSNDVILVSGLHALYPSELRKRLDLRIFLDMDDQLRRTLKVRRDTIKRGQSHEQILASIDRRSPDRERFIQPQGQYADIVFGLAAASTRELDRAAHGQPFNMKLAVTLPEGFPLDELVMAILSLGTVAVDFQAGPRLGLITIVLSGNIRDEDVRAISSRFVADLSEYIEIEQQWHDGWIGVMQLFVMIMLLHHFRSLITCR